MRAIACIDAHVAWVQSALQSSCESWYQRRQPCFASARCHTQLSKSAVALVYNNGHLPQRRPIIGRGTCAQIIIDSGFAAVLLLMQLHYTLPCRSSHHTGPPVATDGSGARQRVRRAPGLTDETEDLHGRPRHSFTSHALAAFSAVSCALDTSG